ncbi:MAG: hypothetical protein LUC36_07145 [Oscillospiraceae bacterium]|nr:hypothetical protein [Oscillospiraceae bacterium]
MKNLFLRTARLTAARPRAELTFLCAVALAGVAAGSISGSVFASPLAATTLEDFLQSDVLSSGLIGSLRSLFAFPLLLFLSAGSFFGVAIALIVVFVRAYALSCSVATVFACYSYSGLRCAAFISGVPGLILFPCIIFLAADCSRCSRNLIELRVQGGYQDACEGMALRMIIISVLLLMLALYDCLLLPLILGAIL